MWGGTWKIGFLSKVPLRLGYPSSKQEAGQTACCKKLLLHMFPVKDVGQLVNILVCVGNLGESPMSRPNEPKTTGKFYQASYGRSPKYGLCF